MCALGPDTDAGTAICAAAVRAVLRLSSPHLRRDTGFLLLEAMMSTSPSSVQLRLRDGECVFADAVWVSVIRGRVWVTQAGDPADHFLGSGQAMRLAAGAHALVGAEGRALVEFARAPARHDRLRSALARWARRLAVRRPWWVAGPRTS